MGGSRLRDAMEYSACRLLARWRILWAWRRRLFFRRFKGRLMGLRLLSGWGEARGGHQLHFSYFCAESGGWGGWDLEGCLSRLYSSTNSSFNVLLLGGLSLKMLTGALKFGFLVLNHPHLVDAFSSFSGLSKPHSTVGYAIKMLLGLRERKARELMNAVAENITWKALENCGCEVVQSCSRVSMVAKPSAYLNNTVKIN
ncbi:hypothetical protein WN943_005707 [Citrus x changshan-huyou]